MKRNVITEEMQQVEDWLIMAANTLRETRVERPAGRSWWPKYDYEWKDLDDSPRRERVKCTLSEMDNVLFAMLTLSPSIRECLWLRYVFGYVLSYRKLGLRLRMSHENARRMVHEGLKSLSVIKPFRK